jgi:hypothetical protein
MGGRVRATGRKLHGHGTGKSVSADNDLFYSSVNYLLQHRLQCREIAMNVIKRCDPHKEEEI